MLQPLLRIAPLLFASGFCALIYQTTWLREFRLIFGASTAATAAVLGIFMGGLGLGSAILGKRSEAQSRPLEFYAKLEGMIAGCAALTPLLIWFIRHAYLAMGGTLTLGLGVGTIVRLLLSALVLGVPTFLMGGTLPAVARVVMGEHDANRRAVALLYGVNTLGAVAGAAAGTFYFFEAWGNLMTLTVAVTVNALVALAAFWISKSWPVTSAAEAAGVIPRVPSTALRSARDNGESTAVILSAAKRSHKSPPHSGKHAPAPFVLAASAIAGFAFLLMELVWYRMLSPLLGGSTFTFGLILAVALLGIGIGSVAYSVCFGERRMTLGAFAFVSALEALFIAIPYALGDRIALGAMLLRPLGGLGFYGHVIAWTALCATVALPAAIISGMQFPMLIALLGQGKTRVGSETGMAYACNTAGAIVGSFAGGFGFLPMFSAPGVWKFVVVILSALACVAALLAMRRNGKLMPAVPSFAAATLAICLLTALGPTAFWRHSQIGVGRMTQLSGSKNNFHDLMNAVRRDIFWETDGVESSVAMGKSNGVSFLVNGRTDGNLKGDVGTQVMIGLVGATLHPHATHALVVGLGTGSTAGWLAAVPSIDRVDVVELEPSIVHVAAQCAPMNHQALTNPKLHLIFGDARETLLATRERYDLIVSEPSNPYRAGIASLFTREYYEAAAGRLRNGGAFAQWVQAYEVDGRTIETIYKTLGSVFPNIETWQTQEGDLLLVGSAAPQARDVAQLRSRISEEPFQSALRNAWRATDLEGFLAHFIADNSLAEAIKRRPEVPVNTDDRTVLEFAFARNVDLRDGFRVATLRPATNVSRTNRMAITNGEVDWNRVEGARLSMSLAFDETLRSSDYSGSEQLSRVAAYTSFLSGDPKGALQHWREYPREPQDLNELLLLSELLANDGGPEADAYIEKLSGLLPTDAAAIRAHLLWERKEYEQATQELEDVFNKLHEDPWPSRSLTGRTLIVAQHLIDHAATDLPVLRLYNALRTPFSVHNNDESRLIHLLRFGMKLDQGKFGEYSLAAVEPAEPFVPWQSSFLRVRMACYRATGSPLAARAKRELDEYDQAEPPRFDPSTLRREIPFDDEARASVSASR